MYIIVSPKRILIVGTMVLTFTAGLGMWNKEVSAESQLGVPERVNTHDRQTAHDDRFLHVLGASSDEEVYDALLEGKSLAEIADSHQADVNHIINLQVSELSAQLDARLANGSLPMEQYCFQKAELTEIVMKSVYGITT